MLEEIGAAPEISSLNKNIKWCVEKGLWAGAALVAVWCSQYVFFCAVMAVMISQPLIVNWANRLHTKRKLRSKVSRDDIFDIDRSVFNEWLKRSVFYSTYICLGPIMRALVAIVPIAAVARIPLIITLGMQTWMCHYARENLTKKDNRLVTDGMGKFTFRMSMLMFIMPLLQTIALYAKELELASPLAAKFAGFAVLTSSWTFYLGVSLAFYGAMQLLKSSLYTAAFASDDESAKAATQLQVVGNNAIILKIQPLEAQEIEGALGRVFSSTPLNTSDAKVVTQLRTKLSEANSLFSHDDSQLDGIAGDVVNTMQSDLADDARSTSGVRAAIMNGGLDLQGVDNALAANGLGLGGKA